MNLGRCYHLSGSQADWSGKTAAKKKQRMKENVKKAHGKKKVEERRRTCNSENEGT